MIYAGIGSRETPHDICARMQQWGHYFARQGFTLRSGGAIGADRAFELGHNSALMGQLAPKYIYDARNLTRYPGCDKWLAHAAKFHPAWEKCSEFAKLLHARNSLIMLGYSLNEPVDFVICWTKDGRATGGTGQALRIAEVHNIPVFNMFNVEFRRPLLKWLAEASR